MSKSTGRWMIANGCMQPTRVRVQYGLLAHMGLLDAAIREHLELKRLRGADPGAVAREKQDALSPVRREGEAEYGGQGDSESKIPSDADGPLPPASESAPADHSSIIGQETVEINMDAELDAGMASGGEPEAMGRPTHTQTDAEESLEWEVPGDHPDALAGGAGLEGATDARMKDDHEAVERVEDVLEETPDFLRDTPEQERLWFEQRPPRNFDFNE
jgi:hypothetical protein